MRPLALALCLLALPATGWACAYDTMIREEAAAVGVSGDVAVLLCHAESSGRADVVGPGGEVGLFQLSPTLVRHYGQAQGLTTPPVLTAPVLNTRVALWWMRQRPGWWPPGDCRDTLAWYNAGVADWRTLARRWSTDHPNALYRRAYRTGACTP